MDVHQGFDTENRNILPNNKDGKLNQQWDVVYADQYPKGLGKGDFNEDFGLYIERPFYIISELGEHRYLDLIGNRNMVIKTRI